MNASLQIKNSLKFLLVPVILSSTIASAQSASTINCQSNRTSFGENAAELRISRDLTLSTNQDACHGNLAQAARTCCRIQSLENETDREITLSAGSYTLLGNGSLYSSSSSQPIALLRCSGTVSSVTSSTQHVTHIVGRDPLGYLDASSGEFSRPGLSYFRDGLVARSLNRLVRGVDSASSQSDLAIQFCPQVDNQRFAEIMALRDQQNLLALANQNREESRPSRRGRGLIEEASLSGLR